MSNEAIGLDPIGTTARVPRKVRVLIAEDDPHLRTVVRMVLENGGYEVSEARNGREALDLIATIPLALVIADVRMPIMTGAEMAIQMKADPAKADLPILLMSGYADQIECGASAWLRKPFEADQLLAVAASLIRSDQP